MQHDSTALGAAMDYPFSGELITGAQASAWLVEAFSSAKLPVSICSAYLKAEALCRLMKNRSSDLGGRILVRWQPGDLISGASDLESYALAKSLGLEFWVRLDFHGKVFAVPGRGIVVGSANATLSGLDMRNGANEEVCTVVPMMEHNARKIDELFAGAAVVNDEMFEEMSNIVLQANDPDSVLSGWPEEILQRLQLPTQIGSLFLSECLWAQPLITKEGCVSATNEHDALLLGMPSMLDPKVLASVFTGVKIFRWLITVLKKRSGQIYFGDLTAELHESLLDDPAPYRRDVKSLLQNLLSWVEVVPSCGVLVDRPNHSQRIRLVA